MKKIMTIAAVMIVAGSLTACNNSPEERTVGGAVLGGAAGAAIGAAATGRAGGAVAGGVIGAIAGGVIGGSTAPARECARYRRDYYGNVVCVAYY